MFLKNDHFSVKCPWSFNQFLIKCPWTSIREVMVTIKMSILNQALREMSG